MIQLLPQPLHPMQEIFVVISSISGAVFAPFSLHSGSSEEWPLDRVPFEELLHLDQIFVLKFFVSSSIVRISSRNRQCVVVFSLLSVFSHLHLDRLEI